MAEPKHRQVPVAFVGADELPLQYANAFVGLVHPGEIYLNIGSVMPPALHGTPEEREAQIDSIAFLPATPIARLVISPMRLDELIATLQNTKRNYEELMANVNTEGGS